MLNGERVKLTTDLTSYKPGLVVGAEGTVCDPTTMWGSMGAVGVVFDNGQILDVFPRSLETISK